MDDPAYLLAIRELSEPIKSVIEKFSSAVGMLYEPHHIRRIARAQVDADKTKMMGQIELTDLQRRAMNRWMAEETRKQQNFESIADKSIPLLEPDARPQDVDDDWVLNFTDKAKMVSDEEMQDLWAKVLAGEFNRPGSFARKTINTLSSMEKHDAELFRNLCSFVVDMGELTLLIYDTSDPILKKYSLSFDALSHLEAIGLVHFSFVGHYLTLGLPQEFHLYYYGEKVYLRLSDKEPSQMQTGQVKLTKVADELARICGSKRIPDFLPYVRAQWVQRGYLISPPAP